MDIKRLSRQTCRLTDPPGVVSWASVAGRLERQGPLGGSIDITDDDSFFGKKTKFACMVSIAVGMALILVSRTEWLIGLGCIFTGLGYGVIQPIAYDKTTRTAIPEKVTLALAFVMAMNYLAILLCPFIINILKDMLHIETQQFAFIFNMAIALIAAAWAYLKQDSFLFDDRIKQV